MKKNAPQTTENRGVSWTFIAGVMVLVALVWGAYKTTTHEDKRPAATNIHSAGASKTNKNAPDALSFTLRESQTSPDDAPGARLVAGKALSAAETAELLGRLPALPEEKTAQTDFAFRKRSKPAPRPGATIQAAFPPDADAASALPPAATKGPLKLVRFTPVGDTPIATKLTLTFSQPMVAITGQKDAAQTVPARIEPAVEGTWRWVDARTAFFEPRGERFPMATDYKVTVNPDLKSATGNKLQKNESWTFSLPALEVTRVYPQEGAHSRKPPIYMEFNQRVGFKEVIKSVRLLAGDRSYKLRRLSDKKFAKDPTLSRLVAAARPGHWIAFEPAGTLPANAKFTLKLMTGAPSIEGKKRSKLPQSSHFKTYSPLQITGVSCTKDSPCDPDKSWAFETNNPLDTRTLSPKMIHIEPRLPGMDVQFQDAGFSISGLFTPQTTYTVTIDASLKDIYGQTLGVDTEATLRVGKAAPLFGAAASALTVLDPALNGHFPVYSINYTEMRVHAYQVAPSDWPKYLAFLRNIFRNGHATPPGKQVFSQTLKIKSIDDTLTYTSIDLRSLLNKNGHGHLVVIAEPKALPPRGHLVLDGEPADQQPASTADLPKVVTWVQSTDIALDAFVSDGELLGWASSLASGAPLAGVELSLIHATKPPQKTAQNGLATLSLPSVGESGNILLARNRNDLAFLPEYSSEWSTGSSRWISRRRQPELLWHVFDDRGVYQPGETVNVKGWLRASQPTRERSLTMSAAQSISYSVFGSRDNSIATGTKKIDKSGGFDLSFKLPDDVNLGKARIEISAKAPGVTGKTTHTFQIQEFRRPEFEVAVAKSAGPHLIGQSSTLSLNAHYYAGGGLGGAPVKWTLDTQESRYTPPGRSDYIFGRWQPWWMRLWFADSDNTSQTAKHFEGHTDATGAHNLDIHFDRARLPFPHTITAGGSVTDVNRQTWADSTRMLVHPANAYVGIRSDTSFVAANQTLEITAIVSDIDGNLLSDRALTITAARMEPRAIDGTWTETARDKKTCALNSSGTPQSCKFKPGRGGMWRITALTHDKAGRANMSRMSVWVTGSTWTSGQPAKKHQLHLIPQKEAYQPGETAKILIEAPFPGAEALITVRQNGLVSHKRFKIEGTSHTYAYKISEADYPNIYVQADLLGSAPRGDKFAATLIEHFPQKPAYASGSVKLEISPKGRALTVDIAPRHAAMAPGQATRLDLKVRDAQGARVSNATVAVIAVDEAILALSGYTLKDPIDVFYPQKSANVLDHYLQERLLLATFPDLKRNLTKHEYVACTFLIGVKPVVIDGKARLEATNSFSGCGAGYGYGTGHGHGGALKPIALRSNFEPLALFSPTVKTDKNGEASVKLTLPDNLTRYRLMAVAVAGDAQFGKGESALTARLGLMVRPSPPRFLNYGDRIEVPVVVQNQTDTPMQVRIAARASNLRLGKRAGRLIEVPANDRVEVRFKAVTEQTGKAVFQVAASAGGQSDAATREFPVWTPATTEGFATYGTVDKDGAMMTQPIAPPADALSQFGGMEITTSSTALQSLTDALVYLVDYPFGCAEQIASRVMAVAALRDVLQAFQAGGLPDKSKLIASVGRDITELRKLQRPDGGFYLWSSYDWVHFPFVDVHVTHALQRAKMKGFDVPSHMLDAARRHLTRIEDFIPDTYSTLARNTVLAYAYYVLDLMGEPVHDAARNLAAKKPVAELSLEAVGLLMSTLADDPRAKKRVAELSRIVQNRVDETAGTAQFTASYGGQDHVLMYSDRRTDALLLDAWMLTQPKSDLIPKLVRGLLGGRTRGHWLNTQENVFILLALDRYFETYEKQTPDFVANMWLGDGFAGAHTFKGRTTDYKNTTVPMKSVMQTGSRNDGTNLVIQKDGPGRLYWRIGMNYALKSFKVDAADYGFSVQRKYEAVDNPEDVSQRADGTWEVKLGSRVRVRLTMVAPARRYHVALVDPLPAGLEPLNPALAVTEALPDDPNAETPDSPYPWERRPWYAHQNLRDERAEAFAPQVGAGVHEYSYVTRATTPGEFVAGPTKAEEMYNPATFGRSPTARMFVK